MIQQVNPCFHLNSTHPKWIKLKIPKYFRVMYRYRIVIGIQTTNIKSEIPHQLENVFAMGCYTEIKFRIGLTTIYTIDGDEIFLIPEWNNATEYIDYIEFDLSNQLKRLYWDDQNSLTYEELFSVNYENSLNIITYGDYDYNIGDSRPDGATLTGYGNTELLLTEVCNWKDTAWKSDQDPFENYMDWQYLVEEGTFVQGSSLENDVVILDFNTDKNDNIYTQPGNQHYTQYEYLELPFYLFNAQNITEIILTINYGDGSSEEISINVTEKVSENGFYSNNFRHQIFGKRIDDMKFDFRFNENATAEIKSHIGFGGLALYTPQSFGKLSIHTNCSTDYEYLLYPTTFTGKTSPIFEIIDIGLIEDFEKIESIFIEGSEGWTDSQYAEMYGSNLYLNSFSIIETNSTDDITIVENKYSYDFDEYQRNLHRSLTEWYSPASLVNDWQDMAIADTFVDTPIGLNQLNFDFNGDSFYDLTILEFDGEGIGDFDNNIKDTFSYDFGSDGYYEFQVVFDTQEFSFQVTEPTLYDMEENQWGGESGHYFVSRYKRELIETSFDSDFDGIFDRKEEIFLSQQSYAVPEYREFIIMENELVAFGNALWNAPLVGFKRSVDKDGDGIFEETIERTDKWGNDIFVTEDGYDHMIFESYDYINETYSESGNMIARNASFYLMGPDILLLDENGMMQFDFDGNVMYNRTSISGEFIFQFDVKVPIDPRYNSSNLDEGDHSIEVLPELMCDQHGVVAWYKGDGSYDTAFIFTEKSWEDNISIAIYKSKSGSHRIETNSIRFQTSGDQLIPLHWLSASYNFSDFMGIAWEDSKEAYMQQLEGFIDGQGNSMTASFYLDTLSQAGIMTSTKLICMALPTGPLTKLLTFGIIMGANTIYQYFIRPSLVATMSEYGIWGMAKPIPEWDPEPEDDEGDFLVQGWEQLCQDYTDWNSPSAPKYSYQNLIFSNTNLWFQDTEWRDPGEPKPNSYTIDFEVPYSNFISDAFMAFKYWYADWWTENFDPEEVVWNDADWVIDDWMPDIPNIEEWENYYDVRDWIDEIYHDGYDPVAFDYIGMASKRYDLLGRTSRLAYNSYWHDFDPIDDPEHDHQMLDIEQRLLSTQYFRSVALGLDYAGRPMLVPVSEPDKNLDDPIMREIDYLEMCLLSVYWTEFEEYRSQDIGIIAIQLGLGAIQVAVSIGCASFATYMVSPTAYLSQFSSGWDFVKNFGWEIFTETIVEESISAGLHTLGMSSGLADLIGESSGEFSVISAQIDAMGTKTYAITDHTKEMLTRLQNQMSSSAHPITDSKIFSSDGVHIVNEENMDKAQMVDNLKSILMARNALSTLIELRNDLIFMQRLNNFINKEMGVKINLVNVLDNLDGKMPILKFTKTDSEIRQEFGRIWENVMAGEIVAPFLSDEENREAFGVEGEAFMFFEKIVKGIGTYI